MRIIKKYEQAMHLFLDKDISMPNGKKLLGGVVCRTGV